MDETLVGRRAGQAEFLLAEYGRTRELDLLLKALRELTALREEYRQNPGAFGEHLDRLKALGPELFKELAPRADEVAAAYRALMLRQDAIKAASELYRGALVEICRGRGEEKPEFAGGRITAQRTEGLHLPRANSGPRKELESLLRERGLWEEASALSSPRFAALIKKEGLPAADREKLESLCTRETSFRITVKRSSPGEKERDARAEAATAGAEEDE